MYIKSEIILFTFRFSAYFYSLFLEDVAAENINISNIFFITLKLNIKGELFKCPQKSLFRN